MFKAALVSVAFMALVAFVFNRYLNYKEKRDERHLADSVSRRAGADVK